MKNNRKTDFLRFMLTEIEDKISNVEEELKFAKESRDAEDKSSAGDKYETGRAMMHLEIQNKETQRAKYRDTLRVLNTIETNTTLHKVDIGSLVCTSAGNYFISVALGKVVPSPSESFYAISLASPLGKLLHGKQVDDTIRLNGREFTILEIK